MCLCGSLCVCVCCCIDSLLHRRKSTGQEIEKIKRERGREWGGRAKFTHKTRDKRGKEGKQVLMYMNILSFLCVLRIYCTADHRI